MNKKSYINAFDPEEKSGKTCKNCGLCLQKCPVMRMDKQEAIEEHGRLRRGEETLRVMKECTFCYNCNQYCPHDLKPMALILERMYNRIQEVGKGVPEYLQYLFVGQGESSVFDDVYKSLPDEERGILKKWDTPPEHDGDVLFVGCIGREIPGEIEQSSVLKELPKFGPETACCGELPFRLGDFDEFIRNVERTLAMFKQLRAKRLICYCGSCTHTLKNVWKDYLGITFDFEIISIWEWLWEKVQKGELKAIRKVGKKIALSDSCYAGCLGDNFYESVRGLHEEAGMEIVELKNNKYDNLCCGTVSIVRNDFDISQPLIEAQKKVDQAAATGLKELSCYCPGCLTRLNTPASNAGIETIYPMEDILWAFGDDKVLPLKKKLSLQTSLVIEKVKEYFSRQSSV